MGPQLTCSFPWDAECCHQFVALSQEVILACLVLSESHLECLEIFILSDSIEERGLSQMLHSTLHCPNDWHIRTSHIRLLRIALKNIMRLTCNSTSICRGILDECTHGSVGNLMVPTGPLFPVAKLLGHIWIMYGLAAFGNLCLESCVILMGKGIVLTLIPKCQRSETLAGLIYLEQNINQIF